MKNSVSLHYKTLEKLRDLINEGGPTRDMKYRTGGEIVKFFNEIGLTDQTRETLADFPSRAKYTDDVLSRINGTPKMEKCLQNLFDIRDFVEQEALLDDNIKAFNKHLKIDGWEIVRQENRVYARELLAQLPIPSNPNESSDLALADDVVNDDENEFLSREFSELPVEKLGLDSEVTDILKSRIEEIDTCFRGGAYLSAIIMIGGTLEGILIGYFMKNPDKITHSAKPKSLEKMTLAELLQAAYDCRLIKKSTLNLNSSVREFRNYIHPLKQMDEEFTPNEEEAKISLLILKSTIKAITDKNQ